MLPTATNGTDLLEKSIAFYSGVFVSLVLCVAIHMLAPIFPDRSLGRMAMVVLFFGCLASAAWTLTDPFDAFYSARTRWKYADADMATRRGIEKVISRHVRFMRTIGMLGTASAGLLGLAVLSDWPLFAPLRGFQGIFGWFGVLALLAIPVYAATASRPLREAVALRQQIDENLRASGGRTRTAADAEKLAKSLTAAPVEVLGPQKFRAGGYDWMWSDFYKNVAIFGQSGSGKTVCVLNALLDGLLASAAAGQKAPAGLILDPKGDYRDKIETLCRSHGRSKDLVIVDPANLELSVRWNPLDSEDDALEVAGRFGAVMQTLSEKGSDDTFWIESAMRLVQNLITLYRTAYPDRPPSLVEIHEAAMSDDLIEEVHGGISEQTLQNNRAAARASDYFIRQWITMPDEQKGSVRSFVSNMLGSFLVEPYDELFSGRSDVTLAQVIEQGLILYVYMPIAEKEVMARVVSTFIKLEFYREVLKRPNKTRPSFLLCDEFQSFFTVGQGRGDPDAFERTRQSNHANIVAFQNINALLKQTPKREQVLNLLGNCAIKLFLRNTDDETNKFASTLFGQHYETIASTSVSIGQGPRGRGGSSSVSGNDQLVDRVKKDEFASLAVPSREENILFAETISHLAARASVSTEKLRWKVHPIVEARR